MDLNEDELEADRLRKLRYCIIIQVKHPTLTPDEISDGLLLDPDHSRCVGAQRQAPTGQLLGGVYRETAWSIREIRNGDRLFLERLGSILERLEERRNFLRGLSETGGNVLMYVQLPGDVNIGDTLSLKHLACLVDLKLELGIEVFPRMNPREEETIWETDDDASTP